MSVFNTSDYDYQLPDDLIAQTPTPERTGSRLFVLPKNTGGFEHKKITDIVDYFNPNDLVVLNNTKVVPARLFCHKLTGGRVEALFERLIDAYSGWFHLGANKPVKLGLELWVNQQKTLKIIDKSNGLFHCISQTPIMDLLHTHGHMPLPPYIQRPDEITDKNRYQTVYAKQLGAVAAPTAGLHFTENLLTQLPNTATVTLHVGAGTFQPVRVDDIRAHTMHSEYCEVPEETIDKIKHCKAQGGRVIAVGTTVVRSLETAGLAPYTGDTDIFIYPGYEFKIIDALLTNFHLPQSTLMMLISALAGRERVLTAYAAAIAERYRFFSYGDAMLVI